MTSVFISGYINITLSFLSSVPTMGLSSCFAEDSIVLTLWQLHHQTFHIVILESYILIRKINPPLFDAKSQGIQSCWSLSLTTTTFSHLCWSCNILSWYVKKISRFISNNLFEAFLLTNDKQPSSIISSFNANIQLIWEYLVPVFYSSTFMLFCPCQMLQIMLFFKKSLV